MKLRDKYPNLEYFLGYFNQDWDIDYATAADGIREFLTDSNDRIVGATAELKTFLREIKDDEELRKAITEFGCEYDPSRDRLTDREWLSKVVLPMLEKHLTDKKGRIIKSA